VQPTKAVTGSVSGTVTLQRSPNQPAVPIAPGTPVPSGSEINTTNGTLNLVVSQKGAHRRVSITGGEFIYTADRRTGRVLFTLALQLTGCPSVPSASKRRAVAASRSKRPPRKKGPRQRQLNVTDSGGNFGTKGQYVATSTEGTRWMTTDSCGLSTVTVYSGRVRVTNLLTGRLTTISAGQHYTVHK
jgi:hypothetical protein